MPHGQPLVYGSMKEKEDWVISLQRPYLTERASTVGIASEGAATHGIVPESMNSFERLGKSTATARLETRNRTRLKCSCTTESWYGRIRKGEVGYMSELQFLSYPGLPECLL